MNERLHTEILAECVPESKRQEFIAYMYGLLDTDGLDIDPSFMGFIDDYILIAKLLESKFELGLRCQQNKLEHSFVLVHYPHYAIYDVGCSHALQHVLFSKAAGYIGIDRYPQPKSGPRFFLPSCQFVEGTFSRIVDSLNINSETSIGIANMSILYTNDTKHELEVFDRVFKHKIVL